MRDRRAENTQKNGIENYLCGTWINCLLSPLSLSNLGQALEEKFFEMTKNVRTMDVITVIVNIVVKVLLINTVTKRCRRCRPRNIPSGWKKKKTGKGGGKLTAPATKKVANAISWWRCFCFFTGTEEKLSNRSTNSYRVISFLSIM